MARQRQPPKKRKKMRQKSLRLPEELDDELIAVSEEEGLDQAELMRWGLRLLFRIRRAEKTIWRKVLEELVQKPPEPPAST